MTRREANHYRALIETAAQSLGDTAALAAVTLYPEWTAGTEYTRGHKVRRDGKLWRCVQSHTSQAGWEPEMAPALWEQVNENHSGTPQDPIPYGGNMALTAGLYYVQDGVMYRCIRDTVSPVYAPLDQLVGLYTERC